MKRDLALWTGLLTGPVIWFVTMEAKFSLSWWVCVSRWKPAAYLVSLLGLMIVAAAGALSWSQWRHLQGEDEVLARPRAMAIGGLVLSAGFLLVLVAQTLPELLMSGCE